MVVCWRRGLDDRTVRLWDAATGAPLRTLTGHTDWVTSVAFSPDGRVLASGSRDRTVRLWDAATGAELQRYDAEIGYTDSVVFSSDGALLGIGGVVSGVAVNPFASELGFALRSVSPRWVAPREGITLRYGGSGFAPGLRLRLEGNGVAFEATAVNRFSAFLAEGVFDLTGAPLGVYTAVVIQGDQERRLPNAVEVVDPNGPGATELIGRIIAPDRVRAGRTANIQVVVSRRSACGGCRHRCGAAAAAGERPARCAVPHGAWQAVVADRALSRRQTGQGGSARRGRYLCV
jgi:hypothetical protein